MSVKCEGFVPLVDMVVTNPSLYLSCYWSMACRRGGMTFRRMLLMNKYLHCG